MKCSFRNNRIFRLESWSIGLQIEPDPLETKNPQLPNTALQKNDTLLLEILIQSYTTFLTRCTYPLPFRVEHVYTHVLIWKKDADTYKGVILTVFKSEAIFASFWVDNAENLCKKSNKLYLWYSIFQRMIKLGKGLKRRCYRQESNSREKK